MQYKRLLPGTSHLNEQILHDKIDIYANKYGNSSGSLYA